MSNRNNGRGAAGDEEAAAAAAAAATAKAVMLSMQPALQDAASTAKKTAEKVEKLGDKLTALSKAVKRTNAKADQEKLLASINLKDVRRPPSAPRPGALRAAQHAQEAPRRPCRTAAPCIARARWGVEPRCRAGPHRPDLRRRLPAPHRPPLV